MSNYTEKIAELRREITARIVAMMKDNNLTEIEFIEDELDDPTYVLWLSDIGNWHESTVRKVVLEGDSIELYCDDETGEAVLGGAELACNALERLESVRQNIIQTLGLPEKI